MPVERLGNEGTFNCCKKALAFPIIFFLFFIVRIFIFLILFRLRGSSDNLVWFSLPPSRRVTVWVGNIA